MKTAIVVATILIAVGVGAILFASEIGGSYQRLDSLDTLSSEDSDGKRIAVELTITTIQSNKKPLDFYGHRMLKPGEKPLKDELEIRVLYDGNDHIPIERDSTVFVEGRWDRDSNTLKATKVSTKCPSRYEGEVKE